MAKFSSLLCWAALICVILFLFAPIVIVMTVAFSDSTVFAFPPPGYSLRWFETAISNSSIMGSILVSLEIALFSTIISLSLGTACAIAIVQRAVPWGDAIATFLASPLMLPGLVLGIAFLQASRQFGFYDTYATLLLAHVVITMPFVIRTVLASLSLFDFALMDAARTLGSSYSRSIRKILLPNIMPGFASGGLFAFIASFDNYPVSIFLVDVRTKTLPIQMLNQIEMMPDPTVAAVSVMLVIGTIIALFVCDRLVGLNRMASL